jgi:hypothetical protein
MDLQRLHNIVLRATGHLDRKTSVRDLHVAFKIPYVHDYVTISRRRQTEIILNHENPNVRATRRGGTRHKNYKRLQLGSGHLYEHSSA